MTTIIAPARNGHVQNRSEPVTLARRAEPPSPAPYRFQLQGQTEPGVRMVQLAEEMATRVAERAAEHDSDGSFPFEAVDDLKETGYLAAPVPERFGGMGVESAHDVLVASSRLARGDAALTIGVNMHLAAVMNVARRWRQAVSMRGEGAGSRLAAMLAGIARGDIVMAAGVSEPSQNLTRPSTTAVPDADGFVINGRKIFCTMSPAADLLYVAVTLIDDDGNERYIYVMLPKNTPGVTVHDDWDALGMRASGSHSVTLENVRVSEDAFFGGFAAGELTFGLMEVNLTAGLFHASASLGIAEAAQAQAAGILAKKGSGRPRELMQAAENAVEVSAMRSIFSRAATLIDDYYQANLASEATFDEMTALFAEAQSAKAFINEASVRVVDRALAMSGGAGYMARHPLSRAYRDVRAGAFMHPLGANRAYEFIGQVAIGERPSLS